MALAFTEQTAHILIIVALVISIGLLAYHAIRMPKSEQFATVLAATHTFNDEVIPHFQSTAFAQEYARMMEEDGIKITNKDGLSSSPWDGPLKTSDPTQNNFSI